jgi:hypothetical protein
MYTNFRATAQVLWSPYENYGLTPLYPPLDDGAGICRV